MAKKYLIVVHKANGNFSSHSPDVDGCIATGSTVEETVKNMRSALEFHFEGMMEDGDTLPDPRPIAEHMEAVEAADYMAVFEYAADSLAVTY